MIQVTNITSSRHLLPGKSITLQGGTRRTFLSHCSVLACTMCEANSNMIEGGFKPQVDSKKLAWVLLETATGRV